MLRNFDEEMQRLEQGIGHMIWDMEDRPVTMCLRPLPVTPRFECDDSPGRLSIKVFLPGFSKEDIHIQVDRDGIEVMAVKPDEFCRPCYVRLDARDVLDPESAHAELCHGVLEVSVQKVKKRRLEVR
ncbi:MAG: Hsp20/alpha crystallin family protein [Thermoplasmata archaeon]